MNKLIVVAMSLLVYGCASPIGLLYTDTQSGVDVSGHPVGPKVGEACTYSVFLGTVAFGDGSIEAARRNGGINKISIVDRAVYGVPLLYSKYCTIVRGS